MNSDKYKGIALPQETVLNDRYVIKNVLGVGGFGITYRAYDIYNKDSCAVKELFINDTVVRATDGKTVVPHENRIGLFKHGVKRFIEEAEILNRLNGTPNVVRITDYFQQNNTAYFVMEYIDGTTLSRMIAENEGKIEFDKASDIIYKVGRTLEFINSRYGIFHRDMSPENIMVRQDGDPVIIDFGNAKSYVRSAGESMSVVLKPGFAPPEQYTGKNQGPWTDVYSLAGTFYYMVSGTKVPPATERLAGAVYEPLSTLVSECSDEISEIIDWGLEVNYKARIQSTGELVSILYFSHKKSEEVFPYISIMAGNRVAERWRLPLDTDITIGRDSALSHIVVKGNSQISKQHLMVTYSDKGHMFKIIDISTNGIFINGKRAEKGKEYKVLTGSNIILGNNLCTLKLELQ